jgi:hypothetical protein
MSNGGGTFTPSPDPKFEPELAFLGVSNGSRSPVACSLNLAVPLSALLRRLNNPSSISLGANSDANSDTYSDTYSVPRSDPSADEEALGDVLRVSMPPDFLLLSGVRSFHAATMFRTDVRGDRSVLAGCWGCLSEAVVGFVRLVYVVLVAVYDDADAPLTLPVALGKLVV